MKSTAVIAGACAASIGVLVCAHASAAPTLRKQVDQRGDFVLLGNSAGFECAGGEAAPLLGTATCPASGNADSSPDIFWRSDEASSGDATAGASISGATARTTAVLSLPAGAAVTYARIYWAGYLASGAPADTQVRIERPGGLNQLVTGDVAHTVDDAGNYLWYESSADVTALVAAAGAGPYRVSDLASVDLPSMTDNSNVISAWSMVVFYRREADPPRNLALFDGLDLVLNGSPQSVTLSGFTVPSAGFDAKLGVIAYEGEAELTGDTLSFNGTPLGDAINPDDNFFNSSRSLLGIAQSTAGDLPRLSGTAASMSGMDLDVVDVKALLKPNDTSATVLATSSGDRYLLGGFVTSISTFQPDFGGSKKAVVDLDGGAVTPSDVLEYTITAHNSGNDASTDTLVRDPLPAGVTFQPGSIRIASGPNAGPMTDAPDGDQAEYDAATRTITARLGTGAGGLSGGSLAIDATTQLSFRVTVDQDSTGSVANQAFITASGVQGAHAAEFPTDGNDDVAGAPPTTVAVVACGANLDCAAPTPLCDTSAPKCVECLSDEDCTSSAAPHCDGASHTCECGSDCSAGQGGSGAGAPATSPDAGAPAGEAGAPAGGAAGAAEPSAGASTAGQAGSPDGDVALGGAPDTSPGAPSTRFEGSGCACRSAAQQPNSFPAWLGVLGAVWLRRLRRSPKLC